MSTYARSTRHPETGEFEPAIWHDDFFGSHHYGVQFSDSTMWDSKRVKLETNDGPISKEWLDKHLYKRKPSLLERIKKMFV